MTRDTERYLSASLNRRYNREKAPVSILWPLALFVSLSIACIGALTYPYDCGTDEEMEWYEECLDNLEWNFTIER